ncbi:MAG: aminotransferase class I/II-fold pyridoxal phosphate-dependent enzyme [Clostridia bacterium]|nr:aminotransferase class I/II-fold pyridoxal phosphate-dependent enzyme [Clostridia bacterium]MDE7328957.1 aminotransferase class I/II-fold pyridoxal phosphate-dependent enzyme [Clostridia bacterium]
MEKNLYDKICEINGKVKARFCMPSHSGVGTGDKLYASASFDWTEVEGLDNLLCCDDAILKTQQRIAKSLGYKYALALTQGSTCGMHIAVNVVKERSRVVVAIGDMHKSFYAACRLYGAQVINIEKLESYDFKDEKIGGIFVASPDYFGNCKDLSQLRKIADKLRAYLVVDEAHGAHFAYASTLPDNANKYADIAITSMHKTLPVYGGGALVCVNTLELKLKCEGYRALIHSTSPNYLTMASMDYADLYMRENGEKEYAKVKTKIEEFAKKLTVGKVVKNDDFTRLIVKIEGKNAYKANLDLIERGIYAEMAKDDLLVFIVTPFNCDKLDLLARELGELSFEDGESIDGSFCGEARKTIPADLQGEIDYVNIDEALGRVCAEDVGVYPPGVPFIMRGEVIDENRLQMIKKYRNQLFGLASGLIAVIK